MVISYKPVGGGAFVQLAAEGTSVIPTGEFNPTFSSQVQEAPLFRSMTQFRANRGNAKASWTMHLLGSYATQDLALAAVSTMEALRENGLALFHVQVQATPTGLPQYLPNATFSNYQPRVAGLVVEHTIQIESDPLTNSATGL